jgi:hypothetical protein
MPGISDQKSGSAERWLNESGLTVRDRFHVDKLTAGVVADMAHNITVKSTKTPSFPKG